MLSGALVLAAGVLVTQARRLYFFGDEWAFLLARDLSWPGIMEPHNEHWSTLPLIAYRAMFKTFGIDHHLAYALMPIALHIGCCILIYRLLLKHDIPAWPAVVAVVPLAFLAGDLGENPLWPFQIGFLGSAALGLLALLVSGPGRQRLIMVWIITVLSLMCSGMALPMMIWLGAYLLLSQGLRRALLATVPAGLVYLSWFALFGRQTSSQAPDASAGMVIEFAWSGVAHVWDAVLLIPATGGVVFLALLGVALLAAIPETTRHLALSGVLTLAATYLLLGVTRAGLGVDASAASRYAYFGLVMSLPAFGAALALIAERLAERLGDRPGDRRAELRVAGVVVAAALAATGIAQTLAFADVRAALTDGLKGRILATEVLIDRDELLLGDAVSLPYNPDVSVSSLSKPEVRDALPNQPVRKIDMLNASVVLQVAGTPDDLQLPPADDVVTHGLEGDLAARGCSSLRARSGAFIDLPPEPTGSQVRVRSRAADYPVQLISGDLVSDAAIVPSTPDEPTYVGSTATNGTLRINVPAGTVQVCIGADV